MIRAFIILFFILLSPAYCCAAESGLDGIRNKIREEYRATVPSENSDRWFVEMSTKGTWADIDYTDQSRSAWQLEKHLDRLIDLSLLYEQSSVKDSKQLKKILKGLDYWYKGNFHNDNWWYTKIGIPRRLLTLAYILDDDLPKNLRKKLSTSLKIVDSEDFPARPGGDRIQVISNHAKVMLWIRNEEGCRELFEKIENEARIAPAEAVMYDAAGGNAVRNQWRPSGRGVQQDMTFHHRGDRINSTISYGLELPEFFSNWAQLLDGTKWQFSQEHIHFVIDYYLDAVCRHLVNGLYFEPSIMNRELARPGHTQISTSLAKKMLTVCKGYRADELQYYIDLQSGSAEYTKSYSTYFDSSDYFVFSRPTFHTAVRKHSERNANQEAAHNFEGLRNHFRGDGACMLSVTGKEYANIAPVWDFRKVPGVTSLLIPQNPLSDWGQVQVLDSEMKLSGGISDGQYGAAAYDFKAERSDLTARKAWFFFDEGYVCVGSGIECTAKDSVTTTVEQCWLQGEVTESDGWVQHAGNAYKVLDGDAYWTAEQVTGKWGNVIQHNECENVEKTGNVFTLGINHGVKPNDASYAYVVMPQTEQPNCNWFHIVSNTPDVQAIEYANGKRIYAVFYKPGKIETSAGPVETLKPGIFIITPKETLFRAF